MLVPSLRQARRVLWRVRAVHSKSRSESISEVLKGTATERVKQLLHMQELLLPQPQHLQTASAQECEALLPFTWTISGFRGRAFAERGLNLQYAPPLQQQPAVPGAAIVPAPRPPADSSLCLTYPFSTSATLRETYRRFSSSFLRLGLLLEDLDALAADVAARHVGGLLPGTTVVTAAVDRVVFATSRHVAPEDRAAALSAAAAARGDETWDVAAATRAADAAAEVAAAPLSIHHDLRMSGRVVWAGRSSMEVLLEVSTAQKSPAGEGQGDVRWVHRIAAHFIMVHRRTDAGGSGAQLPLPPLPAVLPSNALEQTLFDAAVERAALMKATRQRGGLLSGTQPQPDEVQLLYQLAEAQVMREASAAAAREAAAIPRSAKEPSTTPPAGLLPGVPMASTSQRTLVLMHRQDRNSAAHIFGGHLLRSASELAYCTAVLHAGRHCEALAMSDVSFSAPVPIGCLVEFNATVVHTCGNLLRVNVTATKHCQLMDAPGAMAADVTNEFHFVLVAVGDAPLRPVEPASLAEAVRYLVADRAHRADRFCVPPLLLQPHMEHVMMHGGE